MMTENYQYIAHRGLFDHDQGVIENSMLAFEKAIQFRYAIELDIRFTKDKKIVVFHDDSLTRMTGVPKKVKDVTLAYIKTLKLMHTDLQIPTLQEVLTLVRGRVPILIEIKNEGLAGTLEKALMEKMRFYHGEYMVESFNPLSVLWLKKYVPNVIRGQLSQKKATSIKGFCMVVLTHCKWMIYLTKPNFIAYQWRDITTKTKQKFKGLPVFAWVATSREEVRECLTLADGVVFEHCLPD